MRTRNATATWMENQKRWQIKVTNDEGVRRPFYCSKPGRAGQSECNRKADEWLHSCASGPDTRCGKLLDAWLADVKLHTGTSNYDQMCAFTKVWIRPVIELIKYSKLSKKDLQAIIDKAAAKGLHKKTLQGIRGAISNFLKSCPDNGRYQLTTAGIVIPAAPVGERKILQPGDLEKLFSSTKTSFRGKEIEAWEIHGWRLEVVLGLRPGELIGAERKYHIGDKLRVRGSINKYGERTRGKNDNAIRDLALPPIAQGVLSEQYEMLKRAGLVSQYIFPDETGGPINQKNYRQRWKRYCAHNGITAITPYELRHTFVSITSGRADMTLAELKSVVGHSNNMDTLGVYGHQLTDEQQRISMKIESAFSGILK